MENSNEMKINLDFLMKGLNGMVACLDSNVTASFKNMTPEQAKDFAKTMSDSNIESHIAEFEKVAKDIKLDLNID